MPDEYTQPLRSPEISPEGPPYLERARGYIPTIIGFLVVVVIVAGGWYLWQRRSQEPTSQQVVRQSPLPTLRPTSSPVPTSLPQTGVVSELPKTGVPAVAVGIVLLALLGAGAVMRRFSR